MSSHTHQEETQSKGWFNPGYFALIAFILILYIVKACGSTHGEETHAGAQGHEEIKHEAAKPAVTEAPARQSLKVKLPDGMELDAYKGGIEDQLVAYLQSDEAVSKEKWFDFDDLNFETGSAVISTSSEKQVQNIAAILKAFPAVNIKIGGYTDNTGDSVTNVKLSQERADAVTNKLKATAAAQLAPAEGYGPAHFVAPNDTEENKKKNRRISINVRAK